MERKKGKRNNEKHNIRNKTHTPTNATARSATPTQASYRSHDNAADRNPYPYPTRVHDRHTVPSHPSQPIPLSQSPIHDLVPAHAPPSTYPTLSSYSAIAPNLSSQTVHEGYTAPSRAKGAIQRWMEGERC